MRNVLPSLLGLSCVVLIAGIVAAPRIAAADPKAHVSAAAAFTGRVMVVMRADLDGLPRAALAAGATIESWLPGPRVAVIRARTPGEAPALADALRAVEGVVSVELDRLRPRSTRAALSDPQAPEQWPAERACLPAAFDVTRGKADVLLAVIDDGFDLGHEDLGELVTGWDFADDDAVPAAGTADDHGTAVLGLAAARADNERGVTGFCPGCSVLPIRRGFSDADDARAIAFAVDAGADVINCSWGYSHPSTAVLAALRHAVVAGRHGLGAVVVFAAGNGAGVDIEEAGDIAATPGVLAVMATGVDDQLARGSSFSARGLAAPAGGGWTTDRTSGGYSVGPYTNELGGTSAAAPIVAGTAGLVLSVAPELSGPAVIALLRASADRVGAATARVATVPRLDAGRAVAWAAGRADRSRDPGACVFTPPAPDASGCAVTRSVGARAWGDMLALFALAVLVARRRLRLRLRLRPRSAGT